MPDRCRCVANACEEGLGNLDGTNVLFAACDTCVRGYYSFDMYMPSCCTWAEGFWWYRIICRTAGRHFYQDVGKPGAIRLPCGLALALSLMLFYAEED